MSKMPDHSPYLHTNLTFEATFRRHDKWDNVQLVQPRIQLKEIMTNSSTCFRKPSQPKYRNIKVAIISRFTVNFVHFYSIYNIYVFTRTSWQKLWLLTLRSKFDLHYTKCQFHTFFNFKQTICVYIIKANFYAN